VDEDDRLLLSDQERANLWSQVVVEMQRYQAGVADLPVASLCDPYDVCHTLSGVDFDTPLEPQAAVDLVVKGMSRFQVHTPHPRYYGLFNPAPTTMGIAADALVAAFNPQLAAWSHSPFAQEVERLLIRTFGEWFGYDPGTTDGTFCSGGA